MPTLSKRILSPALLTAIIFSLAASLAFPIVTFALDETNDEPLLAEESSSDEPLHDDGATEESRDSSQVVEEPLPDEYSQEETSQPDMPNDSAEITDADMSEEGEAETESGVPSGGEVPLEDQAEEGLDAQADKKGTPSITYQAHVQNVGWQPFVKDGALSGTTGRSLRVEGIRIKLAGDGLPSGGVEYRMHVQNIGWQEWSRDGSFAGTQGRSLRAEALQVRLYGEVANQYDVWYRVHVQNVGWMAWTKNGAYAGSAGRSYRMESLQIRLVPKGEKPTNLDPSSVSYAYLSDGGLKVAAHVQSIGWQSPVGSGQISGTTGRSLRVEALRISLNDPGISGGIRYQAHVQNIGWQDWSADGKTAGTTGKSLRVEALKVELSGDVASQYDVYYRTHVQNIGWMAWAKNGASSGSIGLGLSVEALQVQLVPKGGSAPSNEGRAYRGTAVDASVAKPAGLSVKRVPALEHGYKSPVYQRCIMVHDTTEIRDFDYWPDLWISRGGVGVQFMIRRDGSIRQYVDMNQIAYHAGSPTFASLDRKYGVVNYCGRGSAMNQCSIGIELEHVINGSDYPKAQLDALDDLIAYIDAYYGFPCTILQHKDYQDSSPDCSAEFQKYLRNLQDHRTTR